MAWTNQNVFKVRNLVISPKQQKAWATALIDADLTRRMTFDPGAFVSLSKAYRSDKDKTGKGHSFPTYRVATDQDTSFDISVDMDDFLCGWIPALLMGSVVTTGAGPYTHTIKWQSTSGTAIGTTLYLEDTAGLKSKFTDFGINSAEFSGSGRGVVQCKVGMVGSGRLVQGAMAALPALPTISELLASDVQFLIGPPGAPVAVDVDRLMNWSVSLVQDIKSHKGPGSGLYGTQLKIGQPSAKVSLTLAADAADDLVTLLLLDTEREVQININSGAACQLKFRFPSIYFSAAKPALDGQEVVIQLESDDNSLLQKGANDLVVVTAINSQSSYLALGT